MAGNRPIHSIMGNLRGWKCLKEVATFCKVWVEVMAAGGFYSLNSNNTYFKLLSCSTDILLVEDM
jgi:hypothetical protein